MSDSGCALRVGSVRTAPVFAGASTHNVYCLDGIDQPNDDAKSTSSASLGCKTRIEKSHRPNPISDYLGQQPNRITASKSPLVSVLRRVVMTCRDKKFPAPIKIGRASFWDEAEVDAAIERLIAENREAA